VKIGVGVRHIIAALEGVVKFDSRSSELKLGRLSIGRAKSRYQGMVRALEASLIGELPTLIATEGQLLQGINKREQHSRTAGTDAIKSK